tara:strand:+ start:3122 stop:4627 length:1506 start_codon:yes stop_codon:yes gene_type:complete
MNWYLKTVFAQMEQGKAEGMVKYLQSLGVSQDVIDYILLQDKDSAQYLIGQIRNNPTITIQDVQSISRPEQVDPYLISERAIAGRHPEISDWILVSLRKIRRGIIPQWKTLTTENSPDLKEAIGENDYGTYVTFRSSIPQIYDWYRAEQPDIASYSYSQAEEASDEWHSDSAAEGANLQYETTNPSLVVYGPQWQNPEWQGWTIQKVMSENDLQREGYLMEHCVGGYCKYVESGESVIYSLRDPNNKPHVTIETNNYNSIRQIQGKSNSEPKDIYKAMIREWFQSERNPGIDTYEDADDPMDEISFNVGPGGYMYGDAVGELNTALEGQHDTEYGLTLETSWDADDIARKAIEIQMKDREPEYNGSLTDTPKAITEMILRNHKDDPDKINTQLSKFEDYLQELSEEIDDMSMYWEYYGNPPKEEDYETPEEFEAADQEYLDTEQEYRDEEIRKTPQGGFAGDGYKIINELAEKGIFKRNLPKQPSIYQRPFATEPEPVRDI